MITMEDWVTIKNLKNKNPILGSREIAKILGISRNTVKTALRSNKIPEYQRDQLINPSLEPFKDFIFQGLMVKRLAGSRILNDIISKGFNGSRSSFYRYTNTIVAENIRTFMPYETGPGEQAQFDWSPYTVVLSKQLTRVYVFSYILSFSRYRIYEPSLSETQSSVFEALENGLILTSGVVQRVQTDNATCFVTNASKNNLQWNKRYLQFCGHFGFEPTRSLPAHPWSKGKVENPFRYLEDHFIKGNEFENFEDFLIRLKTFEKQTNSKIHTTTQATPDDLYEKEKPALMSLPSSRYVNIKEEVRKVTADCLISFDGNKYSVPYLFACREVWIKVSKGYFLQIYSSQNKLVATHLISTKKATVIIDEAHYKNHRIERGNWNRLCETFSKRFSTHDWFLDKLKTQKRINPCYQLTRILYMADFYNEKDMIKACEAARDYNFYNHNFIKAFLEKNAAQIVPQEISIPVSSSLDINYTQNIKRPLTDYTIF